MTTTPISLTSARILIAQYDYSSQLNVCNLLVKTKTESNETFGKDTDSNQPTVLGWDFDIAGFTEFGATGMDITEFNRIGAVSPFPVSAASQGGDYGELVYFTQANEIEGPPQFGAHGKLIPFKAKFSPYGGYRTAMGTIIEDGKTIRNATGNGTATNIGAVGSTQKMYACIHVTSVTGTPTSVTFTIQSNVDNTFGSPATRMTFTAVTAASAEYLVPVAGPVTDTWWRARWVLVGGTAPTWSAVVNFAIV